MTARKELANSEASETESEHNMGLMDKASKPAFEGEGADGTNGAQEQAQQDAAVQQTQAQAEAADKAAGASTGTAVATQGTRAVGKVQPKFDMQIMSGFKDAMRVNYNTLQQITAQQGNFIERETNVILGDEIVFELMSFQASYVVSPENDDAPDEMVKYSDDGVTCSDGTSVEAHLKFMHEAGYDKARLKERAVVVGAIVSASKTDTFNGTLVQFDLSPASRTQWERYVINASYGINVGKYTPEQVQKIKCTCKLAKGKGTDMFTLVQFAVAE